jgi:hypothetical protein
MPILLFLIGVVALNTGEPPHAGMHKMQILTFTNMQDCTAAANAIFKAREISDAICVEVPE